MSSITSSIVSGFLLSVSLLGNWEQRTELNIRSTHIEELKLENEALAKGASLNQEQLAQLQKDHERDKERQIQLTKDLTDLRNHKDNAERDVAVLQEGLRGKELSEKRRVELEKDLATANGKLEGQEKMLSSKAKEVAETQHHMHELSMNQCGSLTPRGLVKAVDDWADVSPWTICILGNVVFTAVTTLLWRLFTYPRSSTGQHEVLAGKSSEHQNTVAVPIYQWKFFYLMRKLIGWGVAIFALTILPIYLKDFAGRQAMGTMDIARSSYCGGASWCTWGFDAVLTPNAILIAEGESYVHASRGWQRVATSQALAFAADKLVVLMICLVAWPFRGAGDLLALQHTEKKPSLKDGGLEDESTEQDTSDEEFKEEENTEHDTSDEE